MTEFWMALPFTGLGFVLFGALLWRLREKRETPPLARGEGLQEAQIGAVDGNTPARAGRS